METLQGTAASRVRLDKWMDERRKELRLRWSKVAQIAGMSTPNLLRIRKGQIGISWDAADGIEDALLWERGSVEAAVLRGEKPVPRDQEVESPSLATVEEPATEDQEDEEYDEEKEFFRQFIASLERQGVPRQVILRWVDQIVAEAKKPTTNGQGTTAAS